MDVSGFYALFSATCFTLVGLWWKVVESRPQWFKEEHMKASAGGVYLSFLIPGLMGLGAQIGGADSPFWRGVFVIGAVFGIFFTVRILTRTRTPGASGFFRRNRWIVIVIYLFILAGSLGADRLFPIAKLTPIQIEALFLCLLVLIGHGLAWEFLTESPSSTG